MRRLMNQTLHIALVTVFAGVFTARSVCATDWPMWGFDAARRGVTPEALPDELHLNWVLKLRSPDPAWHTYEAKLQFDRLYEPIVANGRMFVGSMTSDRVTAYNAATGDELWRFYTDGPVRFAPVAWNENVYFVCDDGHLYCVQAASGELVWKYKGGPSNRKVLGNDRFIDIYPARGAPVVYDGAIYFATSIWPLMGVFIHALDAESGAEIWTNSGTGSMYIPQQHDVPAFAGITPQGYLAATDELILVAGGQTNPAAFDRRTGEFIHFNLHSRRMGSKGGGGYRVRVAKDFFVNRGDMYRLSDGEFLAKVNDPVIHESAIVGVEDGSVFSFERGVKTRPAADDEDEDSVVATLKLKWSHPTTPALDAAFMLAGSRLYGRTKEGHVAAVDIPDGDGEPRVSWTQEIDGAPMNMIAANGRLYVSTDSGEIYCFSGEPAPDDTPVIRAEFKEPETTSREKNDAWTLFASARLMESGAKRGYCLLLGVGSGRLLEELVAQSDLHIIALDPDEKKIAAVRREYDDTDLYGARVEALTGDVFTLNLPPYLANLVLSEDTSAAGVDRGDAFVERVFYSLRPYGGAAMLHTSKDQHAALSASVNSLKLDSAEVARSGDLSVLKRVGKLTGSDDWTHHNGDAANSVVSNDALVRAPLGVLWFGGPSNESVLPRHGHGPAPQIIGGRLFIEGPQMLRAVDVYNGLQLWEREFVDLGRYYETESHAPGAGGIGGNYVTIGDSVYVINGPTCHHLDAATGKTRAEFTLPPLDGKSKPPTWGFLAVVEDVLIGGVDPFEIDSHAFHPYDLRRHRGDRAAALQNAIKSWKDFDDREMGSGEEPHVYFAEQLNRLLYSDDFLSKIPSGVREKAGREAWERELEAALGGDDGSAAANRETDPEVVAIKRKLLEAYYDLPEYDAPPPGSYGNDSHTASRQIVGLDRHSGEVLWRLDAESAFRHNTIVAGNGKVFAIDQLSQPQRENLTQRRIPFEDNRRVVGVDLRSGEEIWSTRDRVFGTWLGYSEEHDVLLQAGSRSGDRALDEVGRGMVAYQGATGDVLWQNELSYNGPCMLLHDQILTQVEPGVSLNLLTGEQNRRKHPISGAPVDWTYSRNRGCNTAIASEHMITFRSSAAGFFDLAGDGGTGNLGGFRSGCTANLIPANGVLNAPDYTRTCTCSYQNRTSLALVHMPEVEIWTFNRFPWDGEPVKQLGLNFGAPGDRRGPSGLLWLDFPSVGGDSPDVPVGIQGDSIAYFRYHPSRVSGELDWVASSGVVGASSISITLNDKPDPPERMYDVRLYFAEVENREAGERVFDVHLQGDRVLTDFDIVEATGERNVCIVKEFKRVPASDAMRIELHPKNGKTALCGVEIIAAAD